MTTMHLYLCIVCTNDYYACISVVLTVQSSEQEAMQWSSKGFHLTSNTLALWPHTLGCWGSTLPVWREPRGGKGEEESQGRKRGDTNNGLKRDRERTTWCIMHSLGLSSNNLTYTRPNQTSKNHLTAGRGSGVTRKLRKQEVRSPSNLGEAIPKMMDIQTRCMSLCP